MIESETTLSVRRQCQLLSVNRNRLTSQPAKFTDEDAALCRFIDEIHLEDPAFGARKIRDVLRRHHGIETGRARIARLMKLMRISAIYRRPRTSLPGKGEEHRVYPYLLADGVSGPDEAWCADITYIRVGKGFAYLVAVMDWDTRTVLFGAISGVAEKNQSWGEGLKTSDLPTIGSLRRPIHSVDRSDEKSATQPSLKTGGARDPHTGTRIGKGQGQSEP
jgi:putative transposase